MMNRSRHNLLITCEHASNRVPEPYRHLFDGAADVLKSHRGWDPGAIRCAEILSSRLGAPLIDYPWTRLLIEPNRSQGHRKLYSEFTRNLPPEEKDQILKSHYLPYRERVEQKLAAQLTKGKPVVHLSVHTFVPELDGIERTADAGLLFDPGREQEKSFCKNWKRALNDQLPEFRIRMNYPYRGRDDGFTTALRKKFANQSYLGIELEINQKWIDPTKEKWSNISTRIADSLAAALASA
jgi:predicted N-formylglutamate amidohydrolase